MPEPQVTVLMGCWNNAATLPRAIDSILSQSLADLELLIVDDGSTDETPSLVEGYSDPRLRFHPIEHVGISRSLNIGLEESRAPLVAIHDADDWSLPERIERQAALLNERTDVAVVGCWMDEVDERERVLEPRSPRVAGEIRDDLLRWNPLPGTCVMLRRRETLDVGGFDPDFRFAADYDLIARLSDRHTIYCLGEVLAMRQKSSSAAGSSNERAQLKEVLRVQAETIRRRRQPAAYRFLIRTLVSLAAPLSLKRAVRRRRGKAP
jgi:glycosyltransferase involved in cell wall biosynthesis